MTDDHALYKAWTAGDTKAGDRLVDRYFPAIRRFFIRKVTNPADALELVSATFETCVAVLGGWRYENSFRSYLYGIARNKLLHYIRGQSRSRQDRRGSATLATELSDEHRPTPAQELANNQVKHQLATALRHIPSEYQTVLELNYFRNMARGEVARTLGIPAGTVASRIRKGRRMLREQLTELGESSADLELAG